MRIAKLLLICLCCIVATSAVWAQTANGTASHGILGYLDPHTGAFRPVPQVAEETPEAPLAIFGGTITVTLNITIKSAGITTLECLVSVSAFDSITTSARIFEESSVVAATGTGGKRTCKVTIPYSWSLATQSSDTMTTDYSVIGTGTAPRNRTSSLFPLDTRKVPANGATTSLSAAVTM
jgi:hypothetical protein